MNCSEPFPAGPQEAARAATAPPGSRLKHCIVTPDFPGPVRNGGIGDACRSLAQYLRERGQDVTVLFTGPFEEMDEVHWAAEFQKQDGIRFLSAGQTTAEPVAFAGATPHVAVSAMVAHALEQENFDFLHFQEPMANGFVPLQRRRTLGAFAGAVMTVTLHRSTDRLRDGTRGPAPGTSEQLLLQYCERYCVQHADAVISPADLLPGCTMIAAEQKWEAAFQQLKETAQAPASLPAGSARDSAENSSPAVTICIAHYNHGMFLGGLLASLETQTDRRFTVIAMDDGSTDSESLREYRRHQEKYRSAGWRFLEQENHGPAYARNRAAAQASSDYLIFMDSDNIAMPEMVETFLAAIERSGEDCLTCYFHAFDGDDPQQTVQYNYKPVGACIEAGILANVFGDTNFIIRRSVFESMGGFPDFRDSYEDWEFLAGLCLAGYSLDVIPQVLFRYRILERSVCRSLPQEENMANVIRPYLRATTGWQSRVIKAFAAMGFHTAGLVAHSAHLDRHIAHLERCNAHLEAERDHFQSCADHLKGVQEEARSASQGAERLAGEVKLLKRDLKSCRQALKTQQKALMEWNRLPWRKRLFRRIKTGNGEQ